LFEFLIKIGISALHFLSCLAALPRKLRMKKRMGKKEKNGKFFLPYNMGLGTAPLICTELVI